MTLSSRLVSSRLVSSRAARSALGACIVLMGAAAMPACSSDPDTPLPPDVPLGEVGTAQDALLTADGCIVGSDEMTGAGGYADKCKIAMGNIEIPALDCNSSNAVTVPATNLSAGRCDRPNVLNPACDPGSTFQVLVDQNNAAGERVAIVGNCRKKGAPGNQFQDIAMIAHNFKTGGTCFFQNANFNTSQSGSMPAPKNAPAAGQSSWLSPANTAAQSCHECHDNGPFIRTPYLRQLFSTHNQQPGSPTPAYVHPDVSLAQSLAAGKSPKAHLPGAWDASANSTQPYRFVGANFQGWKAYAVSVPNNDCISCHRMGVSSNDASARVWNAGNGTSQKFGLEATKYAGGSVQLSKNPHSLASPIWMKPDAFYQPAGALATNATLATKIAGCAGDIVLGKPTSPDCNYSQFAQGNTCPGAGVTIVVNGATSSAPSTTPNVQTTILPVGVGSGFGAWTSLHGPFEQFGGAGYGTSGFNGSFATLRIAGTPPRFVPAADWLGPTSPAPRYGAGGTVACTYHSEIAYLPNTPNCLYSTHDLDDLTGTLLNPSQQVDANLSNVHPITSWIGNLSFFSDDKFGMSENSSGKTLLSRLSTKARIFQSQSITTACSGWTPTYSINHLNATSGSGPVVVLSAANRTKHRCFISGIGGNWKTVYSTNALSPQPYAILKSSTTNGDLLLEVGPLGAASTITAEASCIQIKP